MVRTSRVHFLAGDEAWQVPAAESPVVLVQQTIQARHNNGYAPGFVETTNPHTGLKSYIDAQSIFKIAEETT